ncbi:chaperone NapD [Photobacterium satsumensis]|uniref:chaperone NapD n=1 Tax=Photobacterium satsumensis TaxID=2910239 RepID=UPI003D107A0F
MNDFHVCSLIVYVVAEQLESIKETIESLPGAEVPIFGESGKLVVVLEGEQQNDIVGHFDLIKQLPGVIDTTLVYHQMEEQSELKEA